MSFTRMYNCSKTKRIYDIIIVTTTTANEKQPFIVTLAAFFLIKSVANTDHNKWTGDRSIGRNENDSFRAIKYATERYQAIQWGNK